MRRFLAFLAAVGACLALFAVAKAGSPELPASTAPALTILIGGQSNAGGLGLPYTSWGSVGPAYETWLTPGARVDRVPWCYYKNGEWGILADPLAGGPSTFPRFANPLAGASAWPGVARRLLPVIGNIAFVPCEKNGSSVGSWLFTPSGGTSILTDAVTRAQQSGQTPALVVWWQGETDAQNGSGTTPEQFRSRLATVAGRFGAEFGADFMPCKIQRCYDPQFVGQDGINQAIAESWGTGNIVAGPDLSDIPCAPEDTVHLLTQKKLDQAAARWAERILAWWQAR